MWVDVVLVIVVVAAVSAVAAVGSGSDVSNVMLLHAAVIFWMLHCYRF